MKILVLALFRFLFIQGDYSQNIVRHECSITATIIPSDQGVTSKYSTPLTQAKLATINPLDHITSCNFSSFDYQKGADSETLWYTWQPSLSGEYFFSTAGSTYNDTNVGIELDMTTIIAIFTGNSNCALMVPIVCSNDRVRAVYLIGGEQYYIRVAFEPFDGENGMFQLTVKPNPPVPPNTKCINAQTVDLRKGGVFNGEITNALFDEASIPCSSSLKKGLWYKVKNPIQYYMAILASTCNKQTDFDSSISVFEGEDCESLFCLGTVDDTSSTCGLKAAFHFSATPFTTYYVLVQSFSDNDEGNFVLNFAT